MHFEIFQRMKIAYPTYTYIIFYNFLYRGDFSEALNVHLHTQTHSYIHTTTHIMCFYLIWTFLIHFFFH